MGKIFVFLLLFFSVIACNTTGNLIKYEILRPAKYTIPPEIKSVVLVDNSYPFENKDVHIAIVDGKKQYLDTLLFVDYPDSLLAGVRRELLSKQFFDTVYYDTIHYNLKGSGKPFRKLSDYKVQSICNKHGADAVLALEGYSYGTTVKVEDLPEVYFSTMGVHGLTCWRLYDAYYNEVLFEEVQRDTIYWSGEGATIQISLFNFPSLREANSEYASYIGQEMVKKIVPEWETVERNLFLEGNGYFVASADWLNSNNSAEAKKLWGYVYENGNKLDKARAAYNIAVVLEREGDVVHAMEWAYNSFKAYGLLKKAAYKEEKKDAKNYYIFLTRRKVEIEKLKQQVGGE